MQKKMNEMDEKYNGIKWVSFNCGKGDEPRFAGLTMSGLGMKSMGKARAGGPPMKAAGKMNMRMGAAPNKNGALIFTFASRAGEARSVDLS